MVHKMKKPRLSLRNVAKFSIGLIAAVSVWVLIYVSLKLPKAMRMAGIALIIVVATLLWWRIFAEDIYSE
jgi:hypothetical protein